MRVYPYNGLPVHLKARYDCINRMLEGKNAEAKVESDAFDEDGPPGSTHKETRTTRRSL